MPDTSRFYNAPEGPSVQPDEELPRRAHFDVNASPAAFGGLVAQGEKEFGAGAQEAGQFFGQVAGEQATNNFMEQANQIRDNYSNLRGQAALEAHDEANQKLQEAFDQNAQNLPLGAQADYYRYGRRYLVNNQDAILTHRNQQEQEWQQTTNNNTFQSTITAIAQNPTDDNTYSMNRDRAIDAAVNAAKQNNGIGAGPLTPEAQTIVSNAVQTAKQQAAEARINGVIATDPTRASTYFNQYRTDLGQKAPEYEEKLKSYTKAAGDDAAIHALDVRYGAPGAVPGGASGATSVGAPPSPAQASYTTPSGYTATGAAAEGSFDRPIGTVINGNVFIPPTTLTDYKARVAQIESGGRTNAVSQTGAIGLYQFIPATWRAYGGGGSIYSPNDQDKAMDRLTADNAAKLSYGLGRAPTPGELYLAHQQGPMGALHLMQEPSRRAGDIVGDQAVRVNGGNPNDTASQFVNHVINEQFGGSGGGKIYYGGGGAPQPVQSQAAPIAPIDSAGAFSSSAPAPMPSPAPSISPAAYQPQGAASAFSGAGAPPSGPGQPASAPGAAPLRPAIAGGAASPQQSNLFATQPQGRTPWEIDRDKNAAEMRDVMSNPNLDDEAKHRILEKLDTRFRLATAAVEQDNATRSRIANDTLSGVFNKAHSGNGVGAYQDLEAALGKGQLTPEQYESGARLIAGQTGMEANPSSLGPSYNDALKRMLLPHNDPSRVSTFSQLMQMRNDGQLSDAGLSKAAGDLRSLTNENNVGVAQAKTAAWDEIRQYMTYGEEGPELGALKDPQGRVAFDKFMVAAESKFDKWVQAGKDPFDFLTDTKSLKALADTIRSPEQKRLDQITESAGNEQLHYDPSAANAAAPPPPQGIDSNTWNGIMSMRPTIQTDQGPQKLRADAWGQFLDLALKQDQPTQEALLKSFGQRFPGSDLDTPFAMLLSARPGPQQPVPPRQFPEPTAPQAPTELPPANVRTRALQAQHAKDQPFVTVGTPNLSNAVNPDLWHDIDVAKEKLGIGQTPAQENVRTRLLREQHEREQEQK